MKQHDSAFAYNQSTAFGASAVGQVVALYDTILRDLHHAISAIEARNVEKRVEAGNHALMVIGELQGVLDFSQGGEAAVNLSDFYNVTRGLILEAGVKNSPEKHREIISMYTRLRAAWSQVERTVAPSEPTQRLRISSQPQTTQPENAPELVEQSSDSGHGGWRA